MISDFHNDVLTSPDREDLLRSYAQSDDLIACAYFKGERSFETALADCGRFSSEKSENLYLAFEDISYDTDLSGIARLLDLKPLYVSLTWNYSNDLAAGALSLGGLTDKGREVIGMLNERSIAVDLAHLNEKSFFDVCAVADKIVCSHTCFFDVNAHPRNLKYAQIRALCERGGLIGLAFYRPFLTVNATADSGDVVRHIDYFCERFGADRLCIGSDINGCTDLPDGLTDYGFGSALKKKLFSLGYSQNAVNGILCDNLLRFISRND